MRTCRPLILTLLLLAGSFPALPCTVVFYADAETALAGNNEDFFVPYTQATFFPPEEERYGTVYFGYQARDGIEFGAFQGGMNDRGLFFDGLATELLPVTGSRDKESYPGNLLRRMLEECATVDEALALFGHYDLSFMATFQLMIADRSGDAAIIEGDVVVRKAGSSLVATNFYQSKVGPGGGNCMRYDTALRMLSAGGGRTVASMRDILDAVHAEGEVATVYSNVYDLKRGQVHVYHFNDYDNVVTFDLAQELAQGPHTVELSTLFPENKRYLAFERRQADRFAAKKRDQENAMARYLADVRSPGRRIDASPSGREILDRYIEKVGGREALAGIRSRVTRADLALKVMVGLSGQTTTLDGLATTWHLAPDRFHERIELDGGMFIERGTDGETCWQTHSHRPGRVLEGDERAALLLHATLDPHPEQFYESVECLGQTDVGNEPCYKLLLTPREGQPHAAFFSRESGVLLATLSAIHSPKDGPQKIDTLYEDHSVVDGILLPHHATIDTDAYTILGARRSRIVASLSYEHNLDIPAGRFALPGEIVTLVAETEDGR
jgi:hypothetical protein